MAADLAINPRASERAREDREARERLEREMREAADIQLRAPVRDAAAPPSVAAVPADTALGRGAARDRPTQTGAVARASAPRLLDAPAQAPMREAAAPTATASKGRTIPPAAELPPERALVPPAQRQIDGLRLISTSVESERTRVVRLTTYEVRPGVIVTLEEAHPFGAARDSVASARSRRARLEATTAAAATRDTSLRDETGRRRPDVHTLRWVDEDGNEFTLSGPLSVAELEGLKARIK
jgi:hypothetical protein